MHIPSRRHRTRRISRPLRRAMVLGVLLTFLGFLLVRQFLMPASSPAASVPVPAHLPASDHPAKSGEVRFLGGDGAVKARLSVEIVDDERSRELGLMYRRSLGSEHGMLFVFDSSAVQSFWMKNTYLPLDMIFVNERGRVVTIHRDTRVRSEQTYSSTEPALYVVEVNAGYAGVHELRNGDRMEWRRDSVRASR
jgi:uncharacterized protein